MKKLLYAAALASALIAGAAETAETAAPAGKLETKTVNYTSDGFCARILTNGYIGDITYKGMPISAYNQLNVAYDAPAGGMPKHDARFFQAWNYTSKGVLVEVKKDCTVYTVESMMGNPTVKDGISYKTVATFTPEKITVKQTIKLNFDLYSTGSFARVLFDLPKDIAGKAVKSTAANGTETAVVIPKDFSKNPRYSVSGKKLMFALGKGNTFTVTTDNIIGLQDARRWGGKEQYLEIGLSIPWTPKAQKHAKGTEYSWTYELTAVKK